VKLSRLQRIQAGRIPLWSGLLLAGMIAGCSSGGKNTQAIRGFDYLDVQPGKELSIPSGLARPHENGEYVIPPVGDVDEEYVGAKVDIRAPVQVMPLLAIDKVEAQGARVAVTLNISGDPDSQRDALWNGVLAYLADSGVGISQWKRDDYQVDSGWIAVGGRSGSWLGEPERLEQQYRFQVQPAAGRRLQLSVQQLAQRRLVGPQRSEVSLPVSEQQRNAKLMINQLIVYYDDKRQQAIAAQGPSEHLSRLSFGSDSNNLPAWLADAPFNDVWREFPLLLERLNFTVSSRNGALGVIDASYSKMNPRQFETLGVEPFELEGTEFSFQLGDLGNTTSITMFDKDGKPVSAELMANLYPAMQSVLRQGLSVVSEP